MYVCVCVCVCVLVLNLLTTSPQVEYHFGDMLPAIKRGKVRGQMERLAVAGKEKLKLHYEATEERERRYFSCAKCKHGWWENVPKHKPVSQCRKCQTKYDAVPSHQEPKIGKHTCACGNTFTVWTFEGVTSPCYACGRDVLPEELLRPRRIKRKTDKTHYCNTCKGQGDCPNKPVIASQEHEHHLLDVPPAIKRGRVRGQEEGLSVAGKEQQVCFKDDVMCVNG